MAEFLFQGLLATNESGRVTIDGQTLEGCIHSHDCLNHDAKVECFIRGVRGTLGDAQGELYRREKNLGGDGLKFVRTEWRGKFDQQQLEKMEMQLATETGHYVLFRIECYDKVSS